MKIPGFVISALIAGAGALSTALIAGIEMNVTDYWGPLAIAVITALWGAIKAKQSEVAGTRSIEQNRSAFSIFMFG